MWGKEGVGSKLDLFGLGDFWGHLMIASVRTDAE